MTCEEIGTVESFFTIFESAWIGWLLVAQLMAAARHIKTFLLENVSRQMRFLPEMLRPCEDLSNS